MRYENLVYYSLLLSFSQRIINKTVGKERRRKQEGQDIHLFLSEKEELSSLTSWARELHV